MIPISIPYVYNIGAQLQRLRHIAVDTTLKTAMFTLILAERHLQEFLNDSVYQYALKAAVAPGKELLQAIKKLTTEGDKERALDWLDLYSLTNALDKFEAVFTAEMNVSAAYLVTKKRGYDIGDLIFRAEILFPRICHLRRQSALRILERLGNALPLKWEQPPDFT